MDKDDDLKRDDDLNGDVQGDGDRTSSKKGLPPTAQVRNFASFMEPSATFTAAILNGI